MGECWGLVGRGQNWSKFLVKDPAKEGADCADMEKIYSLCDL